MKQAFVWMALGASCVLGQNAWSQEEGERPPRGGEMRERMLEEFDADGNGELSDEERQTARETMRERRGGRGEGRRGEVGRGEGRPAPPDPNQLFDEFDADKDGKLSREEFLELTKATRGPRGPRGPQGGPPRGDRPLPPPREFGPGEPLRNEVGERPGPPPRGDFGPPPRGEFGPPRGPRGPHGGERGRGGQGWGGPDPGRLFDRFDEDGDNQLSREEFTHLADRLRELRERIGEGPRGPRGGGFDGPPRRGRGDGPPRTEPSKNESKEIEKPADENST